MYTVRIDIQIIFEIWFNHLVLQVLYHKHVINLFIRNHKNGFSKIKIYFIIF